MHEIERKFLVTQSLADIVNSSLVVGEKIIEQRYLPDTGDWAVRVRRVDDGSVVLHYFTMKRRVSKRSCIEMETIIDEAFYTKMALVAGPALRKTRHEIKFEGNLWEVDEFHDIKLIMAEIELHHEDQEFASPPWRGKEVTNKKRYANKNLVARISPTS